MYPSICKFFSKHLVMWQRVLSHTPIPVWFVGWKVGKMTGTSNLYQGSFPRSLINQGEALRYLHSNVPMFYCILSNGVRRVFSPWILSLWEDLAPVSLVWICFKSRIASPQLGGTLNDLTSVQFQSCCLCQCWCRRTLRIKGRNWNIRFEWIFKRETQIASNAYGGMSPLELPGASYSWDEGRFPHPAPIYFALGIPFSRTGSECQHRWGGLPPEAQRRGAWDCMSSCHIVEQQIRKSLLWIGFKSWLMLETEKWSLPLESSVWRTCYDPTHVIIVPLVLPWGYKYWMLPSALSCVSTEVLLLSNGVNLKV